MSIILTGIGMIIRVSKAIEILQGIHAPDLVFLDLDHIVLHTAISKHSEGYLKLIEPGLKKALDDIISRGGTLVYLTARKQESSELTFAQLTEIGFPKAEILHSPKDVGVTKGHTLKKFLERVTFQEGAKVFVIDNNLQQLRDIEKRATTGRGHDVVSYQISTNTKVTGKQVPIYLYQYTPDKSFLLCQNHRDDFQFVPEDLEKVVQVESLGGGTDSVYKLTLDDGSYLVLKVEIDENIMQAEILSLAASDALGMPIPKSWFVNEIPKALAEKLKLQKAHGNYIVAKYIAPIPDDTAVAKEEKLAQKYYVLQALLGNTDVLKFPGGNNFVGEYFIDFGANFLYRAKGGAKSPSLEVTELAALKNPLFNSYAAEIFKNVTTQQICKQLREIQKRACLLEQTLQEIGSRFPGMSESVNLFRDILSARLDSLSAQISPHTTYAKTRKSVKEGKTAAGVLTIVRHDGEYFVLLGKSVRHEWWDNFGGKSDSKDRSLAETAARVSLEDSSFAFDLNQHQLENQAPSHDLITIGEGGEVVFTYRMYLDKLDERRSSQIDLDDFKDKEYTAYKYVPLEELLKQILEPTEIKVENHHTIKVGEVIISPPLYHMLKQIPVAENLIRALCNNPLRKQHTQGHAKDETAEISLFTMAQKLARNLSSTEEEVYKKTGVLLNHQRLIRNLKANFAQSRETNEPELERELSQSQLHLKALLKDQYTGSVAEDVKNAVSYIPYDFGPGEKDTTIALCTKLIKREKQTPTYFAFYHGCNAQVSFAYDVFSAFYRMLQIDSKYNAFRGDFTAFANFASMASFIEHFSRGGKKIHNYDEGYKECALSVNPFAFGNHQTKLSNSWYYFLSNKSQTDINIKELLKSVFSTVGIENEHTERLIYLYNKYCKGKHGSLYQIMVKREELAKISYPAGPMGVLQEYEPTEQDLAKTLSLLERDFENESTSKKAEDYILNLQARLLANPLTRFRVKKVTAMSKDDDLHLQRGIEDVMSSVLSAAIVKHNASLPNTPLVVVRDQFFGKREGTLLEQLDYAIRKNDEEKIDELLSNYPHLKRGPSGESSHIKFFDTTNTQQPSVFSLIFQNTKISYSLLQKHFKNYLLRDYKINLKLYWQDPERSNLNKLLYLVDCCKNFKHEFDIQDILNERLPYFPEFEHAVPTDDVFSDSPILLPLSPELRNRFAFSWLEKQNEVQFNALNSIFTKLTEGVQLQFCEAFIDKCTCSEVSVDHLEAIFLNMSEPNDRYAFALKITSINNICLSLGDLKIILNNLLDEQREEVIDNYLRSREIKHIQGLGDILSILPENVRLKVANQYLKKSQSTSLASLKATLSQLPNPKRYEFAKNYIEKCEEGNNYHLSEVLHEIPEEERVNFAEFYFDRFRPTEYQNLELILDCLPQKSRLSIAVMFLDNCEACFTFPEKVFNKIPQDSILIFARKYLEKISKPLLSKLPIILNKLPRNVSLEFSELYLSYIDKHDDYLKFLSSIIEYIPNDARFSFAEKYLAKCKSVEFIYVLDACEKLPQDSRLPFIRLCFPKIFNVQYQFVEEDNIERMDRILGR